MYIHSAFLLILFTRFTRQIISHRGVGNIQRAEAAKFWPALAAGIAGIMIPPVLPRALEGPVSKSWIDNLQCTFHFIAQAHVLPASEEHSSRLVFHMPTLIDALRPTRKTSTIPG